MTNPLANWWRSYQFSSALKQGNEKRAKRILQQIEKAGVKLSWLEKLYQQKVETEKDLTFYQRELASVSNQLKRISRSSNILTPDADFVKFILENFQIQELDRTKLQCTGIYEAIFYDFEASLAAYLQAEFKKIDSHSLKNCLIAANEDISLLKKGLDPEYSFYCTPYVYFMRYFLDHVYCSYLAWFLIYQQGLLPKQINILDLAAGPGTVAYGLALLLRSSRKLLQVPDLHLSYYSLEKQNQFQYRGLQFWRYYLEQQPLPTNAYFRFHTTDFFAYSPEDRKVPPQFFDFIVVSHCTFANPERRYRSHQTFAHIFRHSLKDSGHVLLMVQDKRLFTTYNNNTFPREDIALEEKCVLRLVEEMGLSLVWYKYLTSTPLRNPMKGSEFAKFARENLPVQQFIAPLNRQYLNFKYDPSYGLDDYVILARLK